MGIEPISSAWKADNLPLIYIRILDLHRNELRDLRRSLAKKEPKLVSTQPLGVRLHTIQFFEFFFSGILSSIG